MEWIADREPKSPGYYLVKITYENLIESNGFLYFRDHKWYDPFSLKEIENKNLKWSVFELGTDDWEYRRC